MVNCHQEQIFQLQFSFSNLRISCFSFSYNDNLDMFGLWTGGPILSFLPFSHITNFRSKMLLGRGEFVQFTPGSFYTEFPRCSSVSLMKQFPHPVKASSQFFFGYRNTEGSRKVKMAITCRVIQFLR